MSFLKRHESGGRGVHKLPKQPMPPTLKQLQGIFQDITQQPGLICHLTFGDPPEEYFLAVFKDRLKNEVHWALYLGEGDNSMMLWDQPSSDPGAIYQLITAQFPGLDLRPVTLPIKDSYQQPELPRVSRDKEPTVETPAPNSRVRERPTFEGNLSNLQMPNVLQSIAMSRGSGRLEVENESEQAFIFFLEGVPVHSVSRGLEGESSFIELVSWEEGEFRFYQGSNCEQKTIRRRMETLLMEGSTLDDQYKALKTMGLNDSAILVRKTELADEDAFKLKLKKGTGADALLCKQLYELSGKARAIDAISRLSVPKAQWVPVLFNLASLDLVAFEQKQAPSKEAVTEIKVDWTQAQISERVLMRNDTLIYSYPTYLYLLKNEFLRWERFGRPFSVIILQISTLPSDLHPAGEPLSIALARAVGERIVKLKRKTDYFAHYETFAFALLLIETDSQSAKAFANRLVTNLASESYSDGFTNHQIKVRAGFACIPDDCSTPESLLTLARAT